MQFNPFSPKRQRPLPMPKKSRCICPGCLNTMHMWYAWKSSENVIHHMMKCECGTKAKVKLLHTKLDKLGRMIQ